MATAPLLMLMVAALPRTDAAPAPGAQLTTAPVVVGIASAHADDEQRQQTASLYLASAGEQRPARAPLLQALERPTVSPRTPPALAPRTEPGDARGPPATRL